MSHVLDRPIWSALATRHAHLAEGGPLARRYEPSVSMFAASRDDSEQSLAALGALPGPGESMIFLQADPVTLPPTLAATSNAEAVQMLLDREPRPVADERIHQLTQANAADMLALATLTRPGPFTLKALSFGDFWGIREDGRLIAMAGQRLKQPGFTELSGVCTHPTARGRGLGRLLSVYGITRILERGDRPYLHAYATNTKAIGLYESIGFRMRTGMHVAVAGIAEGAAVSR